MAETDYDFNEPLIVAHLRDHKLCRNAFEKVIEHYTQPLYWHIRRIVINHDDTNDLLQNTFMKAWDNIEYFRGDAKLSTWLYKIATNEALTFLAKEREKRNMSIDTDPYLVADLQADEWFDGEELHKKLLTAVSNLPEKQRLVFNMKYFSEMKYEQISDVLGTSVGALKATYHHAVKKIIDFFQ